MQTNDARISNSKAGIDGPQPPSGRLSANLEIWLDEARAVVRRDPNSIEKCLDRLESILAQAVAPLRSELSSSIGGLAPWQIARVKRHVEANLANHLTTAELAEIAGLSENHFARAFKFSVGESPHSHIVACRIERAKLLILEDDLPLSQVALAVGLADQAHLSRLFRRFLGTTPSSWRRQQRVTAATSRNRSADYALA
jgi:AraC family transcriptional regulator